MCWAGWECARGAVRAHPARGALRAPLSQLLTGASPSSARVGMDAAGSAR